MINTTEDPRLKRWASMIFYGVEWKDKDRDGRIRQDELQRTRLSSLTSSKAEWDRDNGLNASTFVMVDRNDDGRITYEEITKFVTKKTGPIKFDAKKVMDSLLKTGRYEAPGLPVMICTKENIPPALLRDMDINAEFIRNDVVTIQASKKNGAYGGPIQHGKDKFVVLVIKDSLLKKGSVAYLDTVLKYEAEHIRSYFSGRTAEITGFVNQIMNAAMSNNKLLAKGAEWAMGFATSAVKAVGEPPAYFISIKALTEQKDIYNLQYECQKINFRIFTGLEAEKTLRSLGESSLADDLRKMLDSSLDKKTVTSLNSMMQKLEIKDPKVRARCQIYPNMSMETGNRVYGDMRSK